MTSGKIASRLSLIAYRALPFALVGALSIPAVWPLVTAPFFASDDGLFHLYRLAALDDALRHGDFYPRVFPSFAFGYGQAVLNYYGPLSYYMAELVHLLGASFPDAIKWTFALGMVASGWTAFALARRFVSPLPALLGALAYIYFPYHLAETYQRGALAEHLAFVWLPLILWALTPDRTRRTAIIFVLSLAALILTHSLTTLIFLPFVIVYAIVVNSVRYTPRNRAWLIGIWSLGLCPVRLLHGVRILLAFALTAFYWLPITTESRWVGLSAGLENEGYLAHLAPLTSFAQPSLVFQYAPQQIVAADHPLALLSVIVLCVALVVGMRAWARRDPLALPLALFVGLTLVALFMVTDASAFVWRALRNPLTFLQYPWRFMTLAGLGVAMGVALAGGWVDAYTRKRVNEETGRRGNERPLIASFIGLLVYPFTILLFIITATAALPWRPLAVTPSDAQAMWQNDFANRQIGATWTAEYMPWWVRADRTAIPAANRAPASDVTVSAPRAELLTAGYTTSKYRISPPPLQSGGGAGVGVLRFHQFYLPQWRATLDGKPLAMYPSTDLGLLTIGVPAVSHDSDEGDGAILTLDFAMTDTERIAALISLAALVITAWLWRGRWLAIPIVVVSVVGLLLTTQPPNHLTTQPSNTQIEDFATLLAADIDRATYYAGDTVRVTLTWQAQRETRENVKGFAHLMDPSGARVIAQSDSDPGGGFTPTSQWRAGEVIAETRVLQIPDDAVPGVLPLYAGLYRAQPLKNLAATRDGQAIPDGRIPIGEVHVGAR